MKEALLRLGRLLSAFSGGYYCLGSDWSDLPFWIIARRRLVTMHKPTICVSYQSRASGYVRQKKSWHLPEHQEVHKEYFLRYWMIVNIKFVTRLKLPCLKDVKPFATIINVLHLNTTPDNSICLRRLLPRLRSTFGETGKDRWPAKSREEQCGFSIQLEQIVTDYEATRKRKLEATKGAKKQLFPV